MDRTGLRKLARLVALTTVIATLLAAPASAQIFGRVWGPVNASGEPTDPDGTCLLLHDADVDLEDYGLKTTVPEVEAEAQSWFDALLDLLRQVGLLPTKGSG